MAHVSCINTLCRRSPFHCWVWRMNRHALDYLQCVYCLRVYYPSTAELDDLRQWTPDELTNSGDHPNG